MQIEKYNDNQTRILIESFSDEEYEKFLLERVNQNSLHRR